ncbi:terminase large subunit [Listeria monocytogenes]|nr:terminase large subunit [Listeria monocytogenes]EAE6793481.1 terminase large subunit [Listeria monocytogenes]EAE6802621.1 terminase large subunit [Listeria monocytogenes]EAE6842260.1 terminase large subunit [Listeria monocytogenes]EAG1669239.1 terminase large subunit [Listeria monocytogenes]
MISNRHVDAYIEAYESGKILLNEERIDLIKWLQKTILIRDDLYFDETRIDNFIRFAEKWYYKLEPFQKFIAAFVFLYRKKDDEVHFKEIFLTFGRGGGKNGFISVLAHFFISPLHGIKRYSISIVANSEEQAMTSFDDVFNCIKDNKLTGSFKNARAKITGKATDSILKARTSNADTKDGGRDACVIFDEVHRYENQKTVDVFTSGLGKVPNSRIFYIGTDGFVREGFNDKLKERTEAILKNESDDDRFFGFICKLDNSEEVKDEKFWEKANPMLSQPRGAYAETLYEEVKRQYKNLQFNPSAREEFMTKRMNLPEVDLEKVVAPWKDILATNREMPELRNRACIGAFDYASVKDFAAVGLLFRVGDDYIWKSHSFARKGYLDIANLKPPIKEWENQGLLTIVDEPTIDPRHVVNWFVEMRENYGIQKVIGDNFRMDLMRPLFEAEGFELEIIRNPRAAHSLLAPRIETLFANHRIVFGDNPLMRWYTNNVAVKIKPDGNKEYLKKDEHRRKTDGFQAFVHALWRADEIEDLDVDEVLNMLNAITF